MFNEVTELCMFYSNQYGMSFYNTYDPLHFVLKGHITFRNTIKNYSIFCEGMTEKEIAAHFHSIIYEILAKESNL